MSNEFFSAESWRSISLWTIFTRVAFGSFGIFVISTIADIIYGKIRGYVAFRSAQGKHGCQKPPRYPHKGWLGLDLMRERQTASDEGRSLAHYDHWFAKLGPTWEEKLAGQRLINTIDMANIRVTFNADMNTLGRAGAFHKNDFLGPGIFSSDGPRWKFSRGMVMPLFKKVEVRSTAMFKRHVDRFIAQIPHDGSTIDVQPLLKKMNFDSTAEFIFGKSTDSLLSGSPYSNGDFIEAFNYANAGSLKRRKAGRLAFRYCLDREYPRTVAEVHAFVDQQVQLVLNESPGAIQEVKARYVLLNELAQQVKDPIALRYECLNLFAGGRDGVAVLAANALFCLARNPSLWQELRETALTICEGAELDFDSKTLKPFRNVIYETIRSIGPSATVTRTAFKDTILPKGGGPDGESPLFMEKGDQVCVHGWGCNHIESVWGDDCYDFTPDRWNHMKIPPEFVPFGGGRRICPAYQQVYLQSTYILIRLTQEFESIENRDPVLEYVELDRNLTESRNGVKIGLATARP
ncbi:cytochrome P450 [Dothidotthia symphoricarpi CBS 119687]|uniref:Cytochrome P450 n=1 Tax=Dothidotthia symphoricarpi CBS 119687 TaxID=1392245 RepID=A0A6A6A5X7_9PLEO|nr:cytochrome P450 [Dothidotthia symphoricarpi CBS 119687]KAF2126178.1 cytochrome P450 [Dothidotthia symphoricarpi CBS 119687]